RHRPPRTRPRDRAGRTKWDRAGIAPEHRGTKGLPGRVTGRPPFELAGACRPPAPSCNKEWAPDVQEGPMFPSSLPTILSKESLSIRARWARKRFRSFSREMQPPPAKADHAVSVLYGM